MKLLVLAVLLAGCGNISPFFCETDDDCDSDSRDNGTCIIGPNDYEVCAFPDPTCTVTSLHDRYDQSAGNLANLCVGDEGNLEP